MLTAFQEARPDCDSFLLKEMSGSAISLETASACGVYVESDSREIARMLGWRNAKNLGDALVYPRFSPDGKPTDDVFQVKPSNPLASGRKYETPKGRRNCIYFAPLPLCIESIRTPGRFLVVTEGVKKTLAACQDGVPTIGLAGVENWSKPREKDERGHGIGVRELCDDLLAIDWKDHPVAILFDTDPRINPNVNRAACSLAEALERHGATVQALRFPVEYDADRQEFRKYGIDDYILAKGTGSFKEFIDRAIRPPVLKGIGQHRNEMRQQREAIRSAPGIFLDRSGTGSGKSHADIVELNFYKRSLTVIPRHETGWEVLTKYQEAGIDAAIFPEFSACEKICKGEKCWRYKYGEAACVKDACSNYEEASFAFETDPLKVLGGPIRTGGGDASVVRGVNFDLYSLLRKMNLPKKSGEALKLCVHAATGNLADCSVVVSETKQRTADAETVVSRFISIVGVVRVEPPSKAVVILNDASANAETLRSATGLGITDITPTGTVENVGRIVQIPADLTKRAKPDKALAMLRSLMLQYPDKTKIGVITHRVHHRFILKQLTEQEKARIVKTDYFRGLASRGSNDWMRCDLLLILGTPRVPPEAVETNLIQSGHPKAISRVLASGKENRGVDYWLGRREDGTAVTVKTWGFYDHHWAAAERSIVAEELRQCVGRARAVCSDGVPDTVVVSTENLGYPLSAEFPQFAAEGFLRDTASVMSLFFQAQTVVAHRKKGGNYRQRLLINIIKERLPLIFPVLTTKRIVSSLKIKDRTVRHRLQNLSAVGLIDKVGERQGWRLSSDHVRRFLSIGGGAALESLFQQSSIKE